MLSFTIIIPTFDHQDTLNFSIQSVLDQKIQDFELVVIGDGAPERTSTIMKSWTEKDNRIKFLSFPKDASKGETYKHQVILDSKAEYIAYLGDDDMWYPHHLSLLKPLLEKYDFVHSFQPAIFPDGRIDFVYGDLRSSSTREMMLNSRWNFFGPSVAAHRRDSYLRLPKGWHAGPPEIWTDLYMWRQWLSCEGMKFYSSFETSVVHLASSLRKEMSAEHRLSELAVYQTRMKSPALLENLNRTKINSWGNHINHLNELHRLDLIQLENKNKEIESIHAALTESKQDLELLEEDIKSRERALESLKNELSSRIQQIAYLEELQHGSNEEVKQIKRDYSDLKNSLSARLGFLLTYPLRKLYDILYKS